jgi:hypothetical protein
MQEAIFDMLLNDLEGACTSIEDCFVPRNDAINKSTSVISLSSHVR